MIYNAVDFAAIGGNSGNRTENWYLADDITLPASTSNWVGPTNYSGKFYGNGHVVNNLSLGTTQISGTIGLFASLAGGAEIRDLTINLSSVETTNPADYPSVTGSLAMGAISANQGASGRTLLSNVTVNGNLKIGAASTGVQYILIGGLFGNVGSGSNSELIIENCVSNISIDAPALGGNVTYYDPGAAFSFGGLISVNQAKTTIRNSYSTGSINIGSASRINLFTGGIIGSIFSANANVLIQNCYSTTSITPSKNIDNVERTFAVGGILGGVASTVTSSSSKVENCVAINPLLSATRTAAATTNYGVGRIMGFAPSGKITLSNNYADNSVVVVKENNSTTNHSSEDAASNDGKNAGNLTQAATWRTIGFNDTIWDFSHLATGVYPVLK
jgi:hypothetical protein